jgi:molybdopterin molybdotransferase
VACDTLVTAGVPLLDLNDTGAVADFILGQVGLLRPAVKNTRFDTVIMVDWSAGNDTGQNPRKDAIWAGVVRDGVSGPPVYLRNRVAAEAWITALLADNMAAGRRVCIGFDFAFAYPEGFAEVITGKPDPLALWDWFEARVQDAPKANNRFDIAAQINAQFPGIGPFWFNGLPREIDGLPRKGSTRSFKWLHPRRAVEKEAPGSFECWQLGGAGAVGSQIIMGLPVLSRLRHRFASQIAVWPFEPLGPPITMVEIWPSLIAKEIAEAARPAEIKDAAQVRILAAAIAVLPPETLSRMLTRAPSPEGWIFGVGHETELRQAVAQIAAMGAAQT